ncbi:MAG: methyltransferase domain-containing protein, partial [Planctomycetes bacterium]|nr:methyltransferase domain-containing protein [Planctomycetota bacterium]
NLDCAERIGIEINPSARSVAKQSGLSVFESLDSVEPHSIDVTVSNHALEHVLSPYECLCGIRQVLKPRGRLILCVPIDDWRRQKEADPDDVNHHLYTWTPLLLGNLLLETGFQLESLRIYSHAWPEKQWQKLDQHLPVWLFDLVCRMTAWQYKRRQILAIAVAP